MKVHEFGDRADSVILLLPGTMCYWKGNFGGITPLPQKVDNGETEIHVFYAKKMGEKYLARYKKYFKDPVIHEHDLRHEELLGVYPAEWCTLVREVCL